MSTGRIRFEQIDGLMEDTQAVANQGDILVYDTTDEEFKPQGFAAIPGTWVQIAKGLTTVANNSEVTLVNFTLVDGEIPFPLATVRDDVDTEITSSKTSAQLGQGEMAFSLRKLANGSMDMRVKHRTQGGASLDIDWVVYKVTPA